MLTTITAQTHLSRLSEAVELRLSYFTELETVSRLLNGQGEDIVRDPAFVPSLHVLDKCIVYLQQNVREGKGAGKYICYVTYC